MRIVLQFESEQLVVAVRRFFWLILNDLGLAAHRIETKALLGLHQIIGVFYFLYLLRIRQLALDNAILRAGEVVRLQPLAAIVVGRQSLLHLNGVVTAFGRHRFQRAAVVGLDA